jgi:hypothetical protein
MAHRATARGDDGRRSSGLGWVRVSLLPLSHLGAVIKSEAVAV